MSKLDLTTPGQFPESSELEKFINKRKRMGNFWRILFLCATIVAIIALTALLYNIINGSFGYVVVQNKVDPASLVLAMDEERMLSAPNVVSSEDDNELVKGIEANPHAIGFFGYAYYQDNIDKLRTVSIDGVEPNAQSVNSGEYPGARPLFIYTSAETMKSKPQVAEFVNYYLANIDQIVAEAGYFAPSAPERAGDAAAWLNAMGNNQATSLPPVEPSQFTGEDTLVMAGSSTVYPLTREAAKLFRRAGFAGPIQLESVGTTEGFRLFCTSNGVDIANASRPINRAEIEACQKVRRDPLEFKVGGDALVIVVSQENNFLQNVTEDELRQIFTTAQTWSSVNPAWPNAPIERYIPGVDSGTLDFFAETFFDRQLEDLTSEELILVLQNKLSSGLIARFNSETPLVERSQEELLQLVEDRVLESRVVRSWPLRDSLLEQADIQAYAETVPQGRLKFRSWLTSNFLSGPQSSTPDLAGIRTAIFGTLWVVFITVVIAMPLGVGAAIYLEEYATLASNPTVKRLNAIIQTNINNLAGVPSIIYGILGLAIFVRALEPVTSGTVFGLADPTTANGRTVISAGLTLALLILPLIIINAQEAIRAVPQSLRQAGMGLGATRWQTIWSHVLPNALPGILTGNILAMSRAIGETAPLVVIGASTFITVDPSGPFSKFTTLPIQIYQWTARPQDTFRNIAAAAIVVLLILLLTLNASAVLLRNKYSRRLT